MYTEADRAAAQAEIRKRRRIVIMPAIAIIIAAVGVFVFCQTRRADWGWIVACLLTILAGGYVVFMGGVYWRPMSLYQRHVNDMLDGRMRETEGVLREVAEAPQDKNGLECYALWVNIGVKNDPEDDRLLYYDAWKGKPTIQPGACVKAWSNDKIISDIRMI